MPRALLERACWLSRLFSNLKTVIPGFNTDIEYDGVVYHVQTEDKGLDSPHILSLVYTGGAILVRKRTSYEDLIAEGLDEHALAERLNRQHKLICAAIRAGRIEDLKRMSAKEMAAARANATAPRPEAAPPIPVEPIIQVEPQIVVEASPLETPEPPVETAAPEPVAEGEAADDLQVDLVDEQEFRAGEFVLLRIRVRRGAEGKTPVAAADVTVKILGTAFSPIFFSTKTDAQGLAVVRAMLPRFTAGRAAILISALSDGREAVLRRIVHRA